MLEAPKRTVTDKSLLEMTIKHCQRIGRRFFNYNYWLDKELRDSGIFSISVSMSYYRKECPLLANFKLRFINYTKESVKNWGCGKNKC